MTPALVALTGFGAWALAAQAASQHRVRRRLHVRLADPEADTGPGRAERTWHTRRAGPGAEAGQRRPAGWLQAPLANPGVGAGPGRSVPVFADVVASPGRALACGGAVVAGVAAAWVAVGPLVAVVLAAVAAVRPLQGWLRRRAARRGRRDGQLPVALEQLAASMRSGASPTMALGEVGTALEPPLGPELAALARAASRGRPMVEVLDDWAAAHHDAGTRLAATALALATVVGSAPARALDGVAATVRERLDLAAERRALAAQARASSLVLSIAPLAFAALLVIADTAAARFLLGSPAGWVCLVAGVGLDAGGAWWMVRLCGSDTS